MTPKRLLSKPVRIALMRTTAAFRTPQTEPTLAVPTKFADDQRRAEFSRKWSGAMISRTEDVGGRVFSRCNGSAKHRLMFPRVVEETRSKVRREALGAETREFSIRSRRSRFRHARKPTAHQGTANTATGSPTQGLALFSPRCNDIIGSARKTASERNHEIFCLRLELQSRGDEKKGRGIHVARTRRFAGV